VTLKKKLIILFIAFTLVPLVLFGVIIFSRARNILQTIRTAQLNTIADLKKDKIETFFHEREADVRSAQDFRNIRMNLPVLIKHASDRAAPAYAHAKRTLDDQLKTFQQAYGYLDVMLTDRQGRVVYVSNNEHMANVGKSLQDGKFFDEGKNKIFFSDIFFGNQTDSRAEMLGLGPVRDLQGNFAGVVALEIDMEPIFKFIQDTTGLGKTGEALIIKKEGNKTLFLSPLLHDPNAPLKRAVDLRENIAIPAIKAAQGGSGSGISYDYQGDEVLAAWRYIPFLRWGLVTKIDASEVFAPVRQLKTVVISVELLMALIGALAALAITRTIAGPIVSLQRGAEAVAAGDLSHRVGTAAQDEIGRLSRAFDAMTDAIDQRVRERTRELETAVAERKEAEDILKLANAYNRSLLEASLDPLVTIDANGKITDANNAAELVTGVSRAHLIGSDFSDYFTEPGKAREGYQKVFTDGFVKDYPLAIHHASGRITHVLYNAVVYKDAGGNVQGVFAAARDITERKKAEDALRLANAYNRSLLEASLDPLVTIDVNGKITDVNLATEKVTGRSRRELIGTDFSDYFTEPEKARTGYRLVFQEGSVMDYALEIRRKDGYITPVLYNAALYRDEAGNVIGVFAAARDITERKKAEDEIKKLNRELEARVIERTAQLEASNKELEAFAYSVSHDLRTPLRGIDGFSLALLEDYGDVLDETGKDYLQRVRAGALKMGQLIDALLNLSRLTRGEVRRASVDLSSLAKNAAEELKKSEPERRAEFIIVSGATVKGDPVMLRAVIDNLFANAWKFTSKCGAARIEFGVAKGEERTAYFVRDNGSGFDMAYANKLFTAFQRLHGAADFPGLGIGLATVQRIIHRHGGKVWAEGEVGKGAVFYFTLS
jgi:PAS domain S-box-containing protein